MGLFSSLFQKEKEPAKTTTQTDIEPGTKREPTGSTSGNLTNGMRIDVTLKDGDYLLTGRVLELTQTTATLGRLPGELSFKTCPLNAEVRLSGYDKRLVPIFLNAVVEESNRTVFKVKDMKAEVHDETRENFRLPLTAPAFLEPDAVQSANGNAPDPDEGGRGPLGGRPGGAGSGAEAMKRFFSEFKQFIARGNVMDMAVGVIIGGAFSVKEQRHG